MSLPLFLLLSLAHASPEGDALAGRVASWAGDPHLLDHLEFTFIVEADGSEKVRRSYVWKPRLGQVTVRSGNDQVELRIVDGGALSAAAADPAAHAAVWAAASPGTAPQLAASSWARFINDSYWLFAPSKVLDGGVVREVDPDGRLALRFDGVGLTPGDHYRLTVDAGTGAVSAWEYQLEGGGVGSFQWLEPVAVGPLHLMARRVSADGTKVIRFEGLVAR